MFKCIFNQDNLVPNYLAKNFSRHGQIHTRSAKQSDQLNILKSHRDLQSAVLLLVRGKALEWHQL